MRHSEQLGDNIKLVLKENVIGVISDVELRTVSSAFYNGGFKKVRSILNVQVPEGFSDKVLHQDPLAFILDSSKKLGVNGDFVGMVTAVKAKNFQVVSKKEGDLGVSVVATAGCSHAESAGEKIQFQQIEGTINVIVIIDGNPTDSCLAGTLLTVTEAKTAALRALDVRSRYSGVSATGTITDSIVSAATSEGQPITYGGPASRLGQLIGHCTQTAVKQAVMMQDGTLPNRSVFNRLKERHLSVEKIAAELSKMQSLKTDEKTLANRLTKTLNENPILTALLLGAIKIDEDIEKGLVPAEIGKIESLGEHFGELLSNQVCRSTGTFDKQEAVAEFDAVDLSPFLKRVLEGLARGALSCG